MMTRREKEREKRLLALAIKPVKENRKVLIIAGSALQANHIARLKKFESWEYIHSPDQIFNHVNVLVMYYGTPWENPKQRRIKELITSLITMGNAEEIFP